MTTPARARWFNALGWAALPPALAAVGLAAALRWLDRIPGPLWLLIPAALITSYLITAKLREGTPMFGNKKRTDIPETITDDQMDSLRQRGQKANPEQQSWTNPEATKRRKLAKENSAKARWS